MGVAVLDTKCLSINPTPPWQRASPPPPRATPAEVQARRQALRQAAQLRAARTELAARVRLLSSPQGRAAFVATLERWTSFADAKMAQGLRELAAMDADVRAGRVPPPRACERSVTVAGDARGRAEARVAEAAIARRAFTTAALCLRSGRWGGREEEIVLDTDEARCRLIEGGVEIETCTGDPRVKCI